MNVETLMSLTTMVLLLAIGGYGLWASMREYHRHNKPIKTLSKTLGESFVVFGFLGAVGVALTVFYSPDAWIIQAVSGMAGYLMLAEMTLRILQRMGKEEKVKKPKPTFDFPHAIVCTDRKEILESLRALIRYRETPLLVVGRDRPEEWVRKTGIVPLEYIWVTRVGHPSSVSPTNLHVLSERTGQFLKEKEGGIVYIEGVEYLLFYNDFKSVTKFLTSVKDMAILNEGHVIILVDPETLKPSQLSIIMKEFERINVRDALERILGPTLFGAIPSRKRRGLNASAKSPEKGSGAREKEAEEAEPLRREEKAKKRG